jgi:transposase InsO family protein
VKFPRPTQPYLATATGWVYLAVVVDLFSRKVVGWSIRESLATELVSESLRQAIESEPPCSIKPEWRPSDARLGCGRSQSLHQ